MSHVRYLSKTSAQVQQPADPSLPIEAVSSRTTTESRRENPRRMISDNPVKSASRSRDGSPPLSPCLGPESTSLEPFTISAVGESYQQDLSTVRGTSRGPLPDTLQLERSESARSAMGAMKPPGRADSDEEKGAGGLAKREKKRTGILGFLSGKRTRYSSPGHGKERGVLGKEGARVVIGGDGGGSAG